MTMSPVADMAKGVQNLIEVADTRPGDHVLILADTRSDPVSIDAISVGMILHGLHPITLVTEPIARYGHVPDAVVSAMKASDIVIWMWPVFITFTPEHRENFAVMNLIRQESGIVFDKPRVKPYNIYFEGHAGILATDYAKFPNKLLWKLAEKIREVVAAGKTVRIVDEIGSDITATYNPAQIFAMQFRPGDPPGRTHFPWGRCGVYNGTGAANGVVHVSCAQGISGLFPEPMRWEVKDGWIVDCQGGGEAGEETRRLFERVPGSNKFVELMFGYHPKASMARGIADPMHWELNAKSPWVGLGTDRGHETFRHIDGAVMDSKLYIEDRQLIDKYGILDPELLYHPEVMALATEYGDPYQVLAPISHEAHGSGTLW